MSTRVLVIDDNPVSLGLMAYLLESGGHEVLAVEDGPTGLTALAKFKPDLVLCDLRLPGMDGYAVARRIRARVDGAETPLVAITAGDRAAEEGKAFAAGFDGFLCKPVEPETFFGVINGFLAVEPRPGLRAVRP